MLIGQSGQCAGMTTEQDRPPLSSEVKRLESEVGLRPQSAQAKPTRLLRAWQVTAFALATAASMWVAMCCVYAPRVGASDVRVVLGYFYEPTPFNSLPAHRITSFEPHSPLLSAGVQVGDLIVDPPRGTLLPGESVQLQIRHDGAFRSVVIRSEHVGQLSRLVDDVLDFCLAVLMLILGITIVFRRRRDVAALAIACALLLGAVGTLPWLFPVGRLAALATLSNGLGMFALPALAYSALTFEGDYRGRARRYLVRTLLGLCALWGTWLIMVVAPWLLGWAWISPGPDLGPAGQIAALALCVLAFADAWHHLEGEPRQRFRWLLLASSVALISYGFLTAVGLGVFGATEKAELLGQLTGDILTAVAVITLTYAVLRHRVIDVGFVISRTLVFAVFTGLLLVVFAAVEWLADHFVHFKQRESSVLLDGAIAVTIYLVFHRARYGIERLVERVFFRASHARQMELQHFLETVPSFSEPDALAGALLKAVDAYAGSRGCGIYRRDKTGRFALEKTTLDQLPRVLAADSEVIIELKTSRKPYQFGRLGFGLAVLALPLVRRAELVGFLAVAAKTDHTLYRPDEIDNLVRTVHQVSSDLYALQLERFQQRSQELEQQNESLREELASFAGASGLTRNTP